jgi:hypothetical protein
MASQRTLLVASLAAALVACDTPAGNDNGIISCEADGATGVTLAMNVGDVATVSSPAQLACIRVQGSASPSRYLFVPANVTNRQDVRLAATIKATESSSAAATQLAASLGAPSDAPSYRALPLRDTRIDDRVRAFERTPEFRRGLENRRRRLESRDARFAVAAAEPPAVGSTRTIRVPNFDDNTAGNSCDNPIAITTTVEAVGENSVILVDNERPDNGLTRADFEQIAMEFDTLIYAVDTTYFGVPTDLDVDERIFILYTPEVNKLSEPNSGSYVGGFFFSGDLFDVSDCAQSNETEIFYLLAADPLKEFGNTFERDFVRVSTRGTIAHEFQHMINIGVKIAAPFQAYDETAWLNEGLSHFAEELVGRRSLNKGVLEELTWTDVAADRTTYVAFFYQNFARFEDYLLSPGTSSPTSENAAQSLSYRGAAWAFVRHLSDHHSDGDVAAFTRLLVLSPDTGIANTESRTGVPFEDQVRGFLVALAADDAGIPNLDPVYEYASWRLIETMGCFATPRDSDDPLLPCGNGDYQLNVRSLGGVPDIGTRLSILSGSGAYYLGSYPGTTPTLGVQLLSNTGQQVSAPGARVFVLRMD